MLSLVEGQDLDDIIHGLNSAPGSPKLADKMFHSPFNDTKRPALSHTRLKKIQSQAK